MDTKLIATLACVAALALGACSGGGAPTTPATPTPGPADPGADTQTQAQKDFDKALEDAREALDAARVEVTRVEALAKAADTEKERTDAEAALTAARTALAAAVNTMKALEAPDGDVNRRGRAVAAARDADAALAADTAKLTSGEAALARLVASRAWYSRNLARHALANGAAQMPSEGGREGAHVRIQRIPRTTPTSADDPTQIANPAAFTSATFEPVMYADGKLLFSIADDADGGDEFKVGGYVGTDNVISDSQPYTHAGLKLTSDGIVIRVGGSPPASINNPGLLLSDFTDTRRDLTTPANAGGPPHGDNGWDLVLTFGAPQTMSVPVGAPDRDLQSDWTGDGNFHWRSYVPADPRQLATDGVYYDSRAFSQPDGRKDLGTYEVWLSNYVGVDTMLEPVPGSGGDPYPGDDEPHYLKYAAYGLLVYTADTQTFRNIGSGQMGRIHAMHFGYSAFADEDGKKTTDIGTAITSASFRGHTLARAVTGSNQIPQQRASKLLRGDATLTVTIPSTGSGAISGNLANFEEWTGSRWRPLTSGFGVTLQRAAILNGGTFSGTAVPTGATIRSRGSNAPEDFPSTRPLTALNYGTSGGIIDGAAGFPYAGNFNGSFYGPRDDSADLEVAGAWQLVGGLYQQWEVYGSFGAKQKPAAASGG